MILYQNQKAQSSSTNLIKNNVKLTQSKTSYSQQRHNDPQVKKSQSSGCFCFKSSKKTQLMKESVDNYGNRLYTEPDHLIKSQAMKLSREIASKSFKNLRNEKQVKKQLNQGTKSQETKKFTDQKKQSPENNGFDKIKEIRLSREKKQQKSNKQQFDMSRITFSAINRSYEKTCNNTLASNNTSFSCDSNLLNSTVSMARQKQIRSSRQKHSQQSNPNIVNSSQTNSPNLSSVQNNTNQNPYKNNKIYRLLPSAPVISYSSKKIKLQKISSQFQPIKEEVQQNQIKKYKFIRLKARDLEVKSIRSVGQDYLMNGVKKVITEEEIVSADKEIEEEGSQGNVKFDYSEVVIDFFKTDPEKLQQIRQIEQQRQIQQQMIIQDKEIDTKQKDYQRQRKTEQIGPFPVLHQRQTSFQSVPSQIPTYSLASSSVTHSNLRPISLMQSSVNTQSNLLSVSLTNGYNNSEFSFSIDSITRVKQPLKWQNGFDGLSCINQNEESDAGEDKW